MYVVPMVKRYHLYTIKGRCVQRGRCRRNKLLADTLETRFNILPLYTEKWAGKAQNNRKDACEKCWYSTPYVLHFMSIYLADAVSNMRIQYRLAGEAMVHQTGIRW